MIKLYINFTRKIVYLLWLKNSGYIHSVKKVPGIDHSKSPLKENFVKNLFDAKLAPLSSIHVYMLIPVSC